VSDTAPEGDTTNDSTLQMRFWPYGSGFQNVGTLNSPDGQSKIVDSSGCAGTYASWVLQGVPAGNYQIQAFIPQWSGLTTSATYNPGATIDQASDAGQWVTVVNSQSFTPGYYGYVVASIDLQPNCQSGVTIFDSVKFTLLSG
jgi:hypothetical protein